MLVEKNKLIYVNVAVLLSVMAFCAGCGSDDYAGLKQDGIETKPITLISGMGQSRSANVGLQSVQIVKDVKVGAFVTSGSQTITGNAELTADGNGGFAGNAGNYPEKGTVSVYAYAPYSEGWTLDEDNSFSVAEDQSTDEGYLASDLLWGVPLGDNTFESQDGAILLNFRHLLSKVNVRVDKGASNIGLADASISIVGVKNTVPFNVMSGEIGEASGEEGEVKAVKSETGSTDFKGSAVIVPQTVNGGQFFRITTADGHVIDASLPSSVDFESGKAYTYTIRLVGNGDKVSATVLTDYSVLDWDDDITIPNEGWENETYGIGDYVLRDGSLMKAEAAQALSEEAKNYVAAVIFSTEVSLEDAAAGYDGYAVSVGGRRTSTVWRVPVDGETEVPLLREEAAGNVAAAIAALDGVSITRLAQNATDGGDYDAFDFTNYSYVNSLDGGNLSGWFVPSFGQMTQIFNNLGGAEISEETIGSLDGLGEFAFEDMSSVFSKVNSHSIGETKILRDKGSNFYISSTEHDNGRVWGYTTKIEDGELRVHSVAGKSGGGRNIICCVAYKLPAK